MCVCVYKNIHKYLFLNIKNTSFFTFLCIMNATLQEQYGILKVCKVISMKKKLALCCSLMEKY